MPDPTPALDPWEHHLSEPVRDRPVIVAFELLTGMTTTVAQLARWGACRPLLLADGRGAGTAPGAHEAEVMMLADEKFETTTDQVRSRMRPEHRLTPEVVAAVEHYDPAGRALWWVSPVGPNEPLLGRQVLGGRPAAQAALEDKMILDGLLADVGAPSTAAVASRAAYDELMKATDEVMQASGADHVVWAGDSRGGANGSGDYVRWIRKQAHARDAATFFSKRCDRVRVSAFLEGVPCSIHAMCLPDGVAVLRPVELAMLRDPEDGRFVHAGMGTSWDPPATDAAEMRQLARRIGQRLRDTCGYRGGLGVDGVLTAQGFRVTEVNPRFSGGLTRLSRIAPTAYLDLVQVNALLGREIGRSAGEVEERTLDLLEEHRFIDVLGLSTRMVLDDAAEVSVTAGGVRFEVAEQVEDAAAVGTVSASPSPLGTFFRFTGGEGVVRVGDRVAPFSVLLLELVDRLWDAGFGRLLMAPDVRSPHSQSPDG